MICVLDSTCLIYLGKLKILDKLNKIGVEIFIPKSVFEEVVSVGDKRGEQEIENINELIKNKDIKIKQPKSYIKCPVILSKADKEVISLAKELNAVPVIDDKEARNVAEINELDYHGSLYLIILLAKNSVITKKQAIGYIDRMIELGFYLSVGTYRDILKVIGRV
jgi:predicted nucleic acid-binding protein